MFRQCFNKNPMHIVENTAQVIIVAVCAQL